MVHRVLAYTLYAGLAVLIVISLYAIINNFSTRGGSVSTPMLRQLKQNNFDLASTSKGQDIESSSTWLTMTTERLDPGQRKLDGFFTLREPGGVLRNIKDSKTNEPILSCPTQEDASCHVKSQFKNRKIYVDIIAANSPTGSETEVEKAIPMTQAFNLQYTTLGLTQFPFELPLAGSPDLYPQDTYSLDVYYYYFMPDAYRGDSNPPYEDKYPFDSGTLGQNAVVTAREICTAKQCPKSADGNRLHITVHRPLQIQLYTYAVAMIPLIFALIFFHLMFLSRDLAHRRFEEYKEALIVAILSVLPLRVVLVPAEIEGLTRVDLILGLGLILIVAVAVGKYASEILEAVKSQRTGRVGKAHAPATPAE